MPGFALNRLDPLFHTPLAVFTLPGAATLNTELLADIDQIRRSDPGVQRSNRGGWHSTGNLWDRSELSVRQLLALIRDAAIEATQRIAPGAPLDRLHFDSEAWINVNPTGALNAPHDHPGWYWSGSYYVATPDSLPGAPDHAGCIEFLDSRTNIRVLSQVDAPCMASKAVFSPAAGQLLLFPSYLRHWVYPNAAAENRVSIAVNIRFVG